MESSRSHEAFRTEKKLNFHSNFNEKPMQENGML